MKTFDEFVEEQNNEALIGRIATLAEEINFPVEGLCQWYLEEGQFLDENTRNKFMEDFWGRAWNFARPVLQGAGTGAAVGTAAGAGAGVIPGAFIGGGIGAAKGLWNLFRGFRTDRKRAIGALQNMQSTFKNNPDTAKWLTGVIDGLNKLQDPSVQQQSPTGTQPEERSTRDEF